MRYFLSTLALTALASSCVTALGINCRGSSSCSVFRRSTADLTKAPGETIAKILTRNITTFIPDDVWYQNGEHIKCVHHTYNDIAVCAFLKNTGGIPGNEIKQLAQLIVDHGCEVCGSVPVWFERGDNDVDSHGRLTFNFVDLEGTV